MLIAGAIILSILVAIGFYYAKTSEAELSVDIANKIVDIFITSKISTNTVNTIELPDIEMELDSYNLRIGETGGTIPTKPSVIFGPNKIKGSHMITWTQPWNVFFKVDNFLYITTNEARYIFVNEANKEKNLLFFRAEPCVAKSVLEGAALFAFCFFYS